MHRIFARTKTANCGKETLMTNPMNPIKMVKPLMIIAGLMLLACFTTGCVPPLQVDPPETDAGPAAQAAADSEASVPPEGSDDSPDSDLSTPERIDAALSAGEIDAGERILYLAYAIYAPDSLPDAFVSTVPWRGTSYVAEIKDVALSDQLCAFSDAVQTELSRLVQGATQCD